MGWVKLNPDAVVGNQFAGGLLRDSWGKWITGVLIKIGYCNTMKAEGWALLHGLQITWETGHKKVLVETDSQAVINWLKSPVTPRLHVRNVFVAIKRFLDLHWEVKIQLVLREGNKATDILAFKVQRATNDMTILPRPPHALHQIVQLLRKSLLM